MVSSGKAIAAHGFFRHHPETNGMIEYFVRPMDGVGFRMRFEERLNYRKAEAARFRTRPPGVV